MTRVQQNSTIDARPGTYALVLSSAASRTVTIGRLGEIRLRHGFYIYVGSAFGPGGLRARLAHHRRPATKPHWHIDYLRQHAGVEAIWYTHDAHRREHEWAAALASMRSASIPLPRFGASDCACAAHLFFVDESPRDEAFRRRLRRRIADHATIRLITLVS